MSIPLTLFLSKIHETVNNKPTYKLGTDGYPEKTCDCIGLIIGAFRRAGVEEIKNHGSNWSARYEMASLQSPAPIELGGLVYKYREPGDPGYALPDAYKDHPDQRDYYHVGVITGVEPLEITHCTSWGDGSGIKIDNRLGNWRSGGRVDGLDYDEAEMEEQEMVTERLATVVAESGSSVRMRQRPDGSAMVIAKVPVGTMVPVKSEVGDWSEIRYDGKTGWMMSKFLPIDIPEEELPGSEDLPLEEKVDILWAAYQERGA